MDIKQVLNLLNDSLFELRAGIKVVKEDNDILRIEVVSSIFEGVRLSKRIDLVTEKILKLCQNELVDFSIIINPLTKAEKDFDDSEKSLVSDSKNTSGDWAGRSAEV